MKANGVRETTTTTGTGVVTLAAVTGYVRFADAHTVGDVVDYAINNGNNWEWGRGTVGAANTLARTTVKSTYVAGVYNSSPAGPITLSGQSDVIEAPIGESAFDPASPGPLGGTTPSTAAFTTVTMNAGTLTSAQSIEAATATWNNVAEKFVGRSVDITDTASHTESYLDLLKVAGVRKTGVRKDGAIILWNGANDDTNYERLFIRWSANVAEIGTENGGTGTLRNFAIKANGNGDARNALTIGCNGGYDPILSSTLHMHLQPASTLYVTGTGGISITSGEANKSVAITTSLMSFGNYAADYVIQGHSRTVDEARRALYIKGGPQHSSATVNLTGGHVYVEGGLGASASAGAAHGGNTYLRGGTGYGTGHHGYLYLGDSNTSGISFFNAAPVAQQSGTGETVGFTAGAGTNVTDQSTFTGNVGSTAYRISDVVKAIKNYGLLAA